VGDKCNGKQLTGPQKDRGLKAMQKSKRFVSNSESRVDQELRAQSENVE